MKVTSEMPFANLVDLSQSIYMQVLLVIIFFDLVTGHIKAFVLKKYNSTIGINGILRHMLVIFVMCFVGVYARALHQVHISIGLCIFFIGNYALSVFENWQELNMPFPSWLRVYFEKLKDEYDKGVPKK